MLDVLLKLMTLSIAAAWRYLLVPPLYKITITIHLTSGCIDRHSSDDHAQVFWLGGRPFNDDLAAKYNNIATGTKRAYLITNECTVTAWALKGDSKVET